MDTRRKSDYLWSEVVRHWTRNEGVMKKAILKRAADAMEKLAIGSALIGIFQEVGFGVYLGMACMAVSFILTAWEAQK